MPLGTCALCGLEDPPFRCPCRTVAYCCAAHQKSHRRAHKLAHKREEAMLHAETLFSSVDLSTITFKDPPPDPGEQECPICMEMLPLNGECCSFRSSAHGHINCSFCRAPEPVTTQDAQQLLFDRVVAGDQDRQLLDDLDGILRCTLHRMQATYFSQDLKIF